MNFRGLANRKLYHAAILIRMLRAELERQDLPAQVVLESVGLAVRQHLLEAYGWFLLELAGPEDAVTPPPGIAALERDYGLPQPLRGELVELRELERSGWLAELLAEPGAARPAHPAGPDQLAVAEQGWTEAQLRGWHDALAGIMDAMAHGLEES